MNAGMVVLYEAKKEDIEHIKQYYSLVDLVIVLDNSTCSNYKTVNSIVGVDNKKVIYKHFEKNIGLCAALNIGMNIALTSGCEWALIMDDDSSFITNIVDVYEKYIAENDTSHIAVLSPVHIFDRSKHKGYSGIRKKRWAMTSGCYYNVRIFNGLGGFFEELFVECLDLDYCYRALEKGYFTIECGEAQLKHHPAETRYFRLLGKKVISYGYASPVRYNMQAKSLTWIIYKYRHLSDFIMYIWKYFKVLCFFEDRKKYIEQMKLGRKEGKKLYLKYREFNYRINMNRQRLVTVVVPVYNVENYLKKCIESILKQSYKKLEIILVDDGSPDKSGLICDEYQKIDDRIIVIHQENRGLSGARNVAIDIAQGEFITFVDSDDWIAPDMIESLLRLIDDNEADFASTSLKLAFENGTYKNNSGVGKILVMSKEEALESYLFNNFLTPCVCGKLWKKSLWNKIRCPEKKLFEDQYTTYKLIDESNKIVFNPDGKYIYFKREDSIGHSDFKQKTYELYYGIQEQFNYISINYPKTKKSISVAKITWELVFINMMLRSSVENNMAIINSCRKFARKNIFNVLNCKYINATRKLQIILFGTNLWAYKVFYFKYKIKHKLS